MVFVAIGLERNLVILVRLTDKILILMHIVSITSYFKGGRAITTLHLRSGWDNYFFIIGFSFKVEVFNARN